MLPSLWSGDSTNHESRQPARAMSNKAKKSKPKRVAAYARRSSKRPQLSLARQMAVIRKYAKRHPAQTAPQRLLREDVALGDIGAQADDGGDVPHVPAFLEHQHGNDGLVGRRPGINFVGLFAQKIQFLFFLAGRDFGNFPVVLRVNDQHRALQFGADFFEVSANVIAIARVVHHDEQDGFFAELVVFGVADAPFLNAELQIVVIFLSENGALVFAEFLAADGVGQDRMLDNVLMDRLDERIIANRLNENFAAVVARRGGHVHLQRQAAIFLQHSVVDVLNGFEPRHFWIVDVVRFVVEHGQLRNFADDFAKVGFAVGGFADGLRAERRQEIFAQILVLQRRVNHVAKINAVNVREKQIAGVAQHAHFVLNVERELKIVAPVTSFVAVVRQNGIVEKDFEAVKIRAQPVQHDDVGRDDEEIPRQRGSRLVKFVEKTPRNHQ